MSSTSSSKSSYDVFLSFRGIDTRPNFTSHLYASLIRKNITTFMDDTAERGEEISLTLFKAIQESKVSVIIFSENYASSPWCLDELLMILDCMKTMGQFVVPIFYHVNPSDVRNQTGKFGEAFAKVKERFKRSIDKVERWSRALWEAANLSGWDSKNYRLESELSEDVGDHILKKLYPILFTASTGLVGIDLHVDKIISLLCIDPTNVRVVGIWGMGGIGKTTIAEVLVSRLHTRFYRICFLRNVREKTEKYGLLELRKRFLSQLLEIEIRNTEMLHVLPTFTLDSLKKMKVLAILDDVNDPAQLEALAVTDVGCLGLGSRIIVISRDKQVLSTADKIYQVNELGCNDALQLLNMKAFQQKHPPVEYMELSERVQTYCKGVPLALKVLGSYLCKKTPKEWESALNKLKRFPDCNIQKVLKISYNDLEPMEKSIFLDIACFLRGYDKSWVEEILNGCAFPTHWGIVRLVDKCLVTIVSNKLEMHDLIVNMGQDIARRKGSRLWNSNDISYMLTTNDKANKAVEGLFLDMSEIGKIYLNPAVFRQMPNLRLLKFYRSLSYLKKESANFIIESASSDYLQNLPNKLSLLHWEEYPCKSLPLNFSMENLVNLTMPRSKVERLWNGFKCPTKLKSIDFSDSMHLKMLPDFSMMTNLEWIDFHGCESLMEIPQSFQCLERLKYLDLRWCKELTSLPSLIQLKSLEILVISDCCNLKMLPQIPGGIKVLELEDCEVEEWFSSSVQFLDNLEYLNVINCNNLKSLPARIHCNNCRYLDLRHCSNLVMFPEIIGSSLVELNLKGCKRLESLPNSICQLKCLERLYLSGCSNLGKLPPLYGLYSLKEMHLDGTALVEIPPDIVSLSSLRRMILNNCKKLQTAVSNSYIAPIQYLEERWNYDYVLNFCNCVNLNHNVLCNIVADALQRIKELGSILGVSYYDFFVSSAGSQIPAWLSCESPGNSIATLFSPGCFNKLFLGFAFCAVLEFESPIVMERGDEMFLTCQSSFKNNNGEKKANFRIKNGDLKNVFESDHVFFWYVGNMASTLDLNDWLRQNCYKVNEASFNFEAEAIHWDSSEKEKVKVKRSGFELVYANDELKNPKFVGQLEETKDNNKRSREDSYNSSKTNAIEKVETHPKRLRQNLSMEYCSSELEEDGNGINYVASMAPSSSSCEFFSNDIDFF